MARKSTSTGSGAAKAPECCAKCESDVAALRKEVAELKKALAAVKKSGGGADLRVDKLLEYLKGSEKVAKRLEKFGL